MTATGAPDGVRSQTDEEMRSDLAEALRCAVPLHIAAIRDWPGERRHYLPPGGMESLGMADAIMFKTKNWKPTARSFNAYARTLAILAYEPGGVDLFGLVHFCTAPHDGCPRDWTPRPPIDWPARIAELRASAIAEGFPDPGEWAGPSTAAVSVEEPCPTAPRPRPVVDVLTGGVL